MTVEDDLTERSGARSIYPSDAKRPFKARSAETKTQQEADRILRSKVYSCSLCGFVEQVVGFDYLEPMEKGKYLHHLKTSHGLEP